jgi:TatD DNase family protein
MIDTHAHLAFDKYSNLDGIINRAKKAGVRKIISSSSNIADSQKAIELSKKYPEIIYPSVGIHPQQTDPQNKQSIKQQLDALEKVVKANKVYAIGETGLDFSEPPPPEIARTIDQQIELFKGQIKIAKQNSLPLIIHSRKAFKEIVRILKDEPDVRGVFHCYSSGKKGIKDVLDLGFYFGVDGNLTYEEGLQEVYKNIPIENILLETDSPFLTPIPYRGEINKPEYLKYTLDVLAKIKNIPSKELDRQTDQNAHKLFSF